MWFDIVVGFVIWICSKQYLFTHPILNKGTTMKANKTARRKAARKAKLRKMRLRVGKILKKKKNGHLTST